MSVGFTSLNTELQTKFADFREIFADGKITAEEAQQLTGLTAAELDAIKAAGFTVDEDVTIADPEETADPNAATDPEATAAAEIEMPAETIDPEATAAFIAEVQAAKDQYAAAKTESEELQAEIDKKEEEYDALQEELKSAVGDVEDAAEGASEEASQEANAIRLKFQNGEITKEEMERDLAAIGVPSIDGEKRTLEELGIQVGDLASKIVELSDLYAVQADTVDSLAEQWGGFIEVDTANVHVNTAGTVVVNEVGAGGPETSGAEGISALDMQKFANMTNEELTAYLGSEEGKAIMETMQGMAAEGSTLTAEGAAAVIKTLLADQEKSTGDAAKFGTAKEGVQVNVVSGVSKDELAEKIKTCTEPEPEPEKSCDPYIVEIDGVEYTMILDNGDGTWNTDDILGITDTQANLFAALNELNENSDGAISGAELAAAGVRLVAKNEDGTLAVDDASKDFDLNKVDSIDVSSMRASSDNDGEVGTFGTFNMTLKDGTVVGGEETFEKLSVLEKLFGAFKSFVTNLGNIVSDIISKLKINADDKQWYGNDIKEKVQEIQDDAVDAVAEGEAVSEEIVAGTEDAIDDLSEDLAAIPDEPEEELPADNEGEDSGDAEDPKKPKPVL